MLTSPLALPVPSAQNATIYVVDIEPTAGPTQPVVRPYGMRYATEDITTSGSDTPANTWYDGRLSDPSSLQRSVSLASADGSSLSPVFGELVFNNSDGVLDTFPDYPSIMNAKVTLRVGQRGAPVSSYTVLVTGFIERIDVGLDDMRIDISQADSIREAFIFDETYAGTGGIEGLSEMEGTRKPYILGSVYNVRPLLLDPNTYIFQLHAGTITGDPEEVLMDISAVRVDGGLLQRPTTGPTDYSDMAALAAAQLNIGEYITCLAQGLVRIGGIQGGVPSSVTCDARRNLDWACRVATRLAEDVKNRLGIAIDTARFTAFNNEVDFRRPYGRYVTDPVTFSDAFGDILKTVNATWGISRNGELTVDWLKDPTDPSLKNVTSYTEPDIIDIDRVGMPDGFGNPHKSRTIRYKRNWDPLTSVLPSVSAAVSTALQTEYKEVTEDAVISYTDAMTPDALETNLLTLSGATELATQLLALHGVPRKMFSITIPLQVGVAGLLDKVNLTYPRFGLDGGQDFVVVATSEDYQDDTAVLTLWG